MHKIFIVLRAWLSTLVATDRVPDPLAAMSLTDLADLPATHPLRDE